MEEAYKCKDFKCVSKIENDPDCMHHRCKDCFSGTLCFWCNNFDSCKEGYKRLKRQQEEATKLENTIKGDEKS